MVSETTLAMPSWDGSTFIGGYYIYCIMQDAA